MTLKAKALELLRKYNLMVLLAMFVIISAILSEHFLTVPNWMNLLHQCSINGIMAIGMTFVILTGGIDLSVGSVSAYAGMISGILLMSGWPVPMAVAAAVTVGATFGLISGLVSVKFNIPSFIVTLAVMVTVRGLALLSTNGGPIFGLPASFTRIGNVRIFGTVPVPGLIWIGITVISVILLQYTTFGRGIYAIGGNRDAAMLSGVRINQFTVLAFVISGALAAVAGIILSSWITVSQPTISQGAELDAIAATVLGGTALAGGVGGTIGTLGGVFLLQIITNIFNLTGITSYYQQIFKGIIIILALLMNSMLIIRKRE